MIIRNIAKAKPAIGNFLSSLLILAVGLSYSVLALGDSKGAMLATSPAPQIDAKHVVARVNGAPIIEIDLQDEMESLYPADSGHGSLRPEKMTEIRTKALDELVVEELSYQHSRKQNAVVTMVEVRNDYLRTRNKYGAENVDRSLKMSGMSKEMYLEKLQRRMTLARLMQRQVVTPSRYGPQALLAYYNNNLSKFRRPDQVKVRLFLASSDKTAKPMEDAKARQKAQMVYGELKAGKDFGLLAEQYSDDRYKVKGGDLGWVHKGRLEPEFEKVAFSLKQGEFSEVFQTPYGYSLMKVEGRESGKQMKFEEIAPVLKAELEQKKFNELRTALVARMKKGAQIEILDSTEKAGTITSRAVHPVASH